MKKVILTIVIIAAILTSCNQKNKETESQSTEASISHNELFACSMHPEITGKKGEKCSKCGMELTEPVTQSKVTSNSEKVSEDSNNLKPQATDFVDDIIISYLNLKNKLASDDTKGAAEKGKILFASFEKFDVSVLNAKQKKEYLDIADDAKEHAEHIGLNGGKIEHQREHFAILSNDISDLITLLGSQQKLYQDFCPMYDNGKGAVWISKTKEIENPYFGKKMSTCGSIKKEF